MVPIPPESSAEILRAPKLAKTHQPIAAGQLPTLIHRGRSGLGPRGFFQFPSFTLKKMAPESCTPIIGFSLISGHENRGPHNTYLKKCRGPSCNLPCSGAVSYLEGGASQSLPIKMKGHFLECLDTKCG